MIKKLLGILGILVIVVSLSSLYFYKSTGKEEIINFRKIGKLQADYLYQRVINLYSNYTHIQDIATTNSAVLNFISTRCSKLPQIQHVHDLECRALWMHQLRTLPIVKIDKLWGFNDTHYGAITLLLQGGMKAHFKPCSSSGEKTSNEIIASHLDYILEFDQTAPVLSRTISIKHLESLLTDPTDLEIIQYTKDLCSDGGTLTGPIIGWWNNLTQIRTPRKAFVSQEMLEKMRPILQSRLEITQMNSKFHSFYWLIQILRHGKDEFINREGNLISLDLDRSSFVSSNTKHPMHSDMNFTWCFTCYFDEGVYESFLASSFLSDPKFRLSSLMMKSLSLYDPPSLDLFSPKLGLTLDRRVAMLLDCMKECISKHGRENVLLNVEKTMTAEELVQWYVDHSSYGPMRVQKP